MTHDENHQSLRWNRSVPLAIGMFLGLVLYVQQGPGLQSGLRGQCPRVPSVVN